jgi:hypothetical protein
MHDAFPDGLAVMGLRDGDRLGKTSGAAVLGFYTLGQN